mmetsp:Transcript_35940/g.90166  ORF Transcript_35940/g.90166 Transcript_35940/m.90166 type:complete len:85 (-) Transcript_35940:3-257(-)
MPLIEGAFPEPPAPLVPPGLLLLLLPRVFTVERRRPLEASRAGSVAPSQSVVDVTWIVWLIHMQRCQGLEHWWSGGACACEWVR